MTLVKTSGRALMLALIPPAFLQGALLAMAVLAITTRRAPLGRPRIWCSVFSLPGWRSSPAPCTWAIN